MRLPSVVSLKTYIKPSRQPAFTRFNVFLRDRFTCQYCNTREELTFDHVIPRSKGGTTTWENVVAACSCCNLRKGDRLPAEARMWPARAPLPADHQRPASERPAVSAELSARQLARLPLLGFRAGAVRLGGASPGCRIDRPNHPRYRRSGGRCRGGPRFSADRRFGRSGHTRGRCRILHLRHFCSACGLVLLGRPGPGSRRPPPCALDHRRHDLRRARPRRRAYRRGCRNRFQPLVRRSDRPPRRRPPVDRARPPP